MSVYTVVFLLVFVYFTNGYSQMDNRFGVSEEDFIEEGQDYRRTNLGDGDLSDRIVVQSTRNDDPAIWFEKEHPDFQYLYQMTVDYEEYIIARIRKSRRKRSIDKLTEDSDVELLRNHAHITFVQQEISHVRKTRTLDPEWANLWYLNGAVQPSMRIEDVWADGYSGRGITIAVLDDGLQTNHPDLAPNVDTINDIDIYGNDNDPYPPSDSSHGTKVAGLIAAVKDNNICVVGAAFNATVIGIRILGTLAITDSEEASGLSHYRNGIDIYSNSWGPNDGSGFGKPGALTQGALKDGVTFGRNGKGSIYLFAAGNGQTSDNCNADGYVNSIYTIAVTSVQAGQNAWYAEVCAAALTAAYGGSEDDKYLTTTTITSRCSSSGIQGTSYSTPIVSGIIALTLEANNLLTWRDIQHLIVLSSSRQGFEDTYSNWTINGAGKEVSQVIGFGLIDAKQMVDNGKTWNTVPEQKTCSKAAGTENGSQVSDTILLSSTDCSSILFLEHVIFHVTFSYSRFRGATELYAISPSGTRSHLLHYRYTDAVDNIAQGNHTWQFMSVHFWWENPLGNWTLEISSYKSISEVRLENWSMMIYGTETDPRQTSNDATSEQPTTAADTNYGELLTTTIAAQTTRELFTTTVAAPTTSESLATTVAFQTTSKFEATTFAAPTTSDLITTTAAVPTASESVITTTAVPTASASVTTADNVPTTNESMTTTAAVPTASAPMTTADDVPNTNKSMTTTAAVPTTSKSVMTAAAVPSTSESITTTAAIPTASESVITATAVPTTSESLITAAAVPTTGESITTADDVSTTNESMTTTAAVATTSESRTTTAAVTTTSKSVITAAAVPNTSESMTTTHDVPTTSEAMTTADDVPTTNESLTAAAAVLTTSESNITTATVPTKKASVTTAITVLTTSESMTSTAAVPTISELSTTAVALPTISKSLTQTADAHTTSKFLTTTAHTTSNLPPTTAATTSKLLTTMVAPSTSSKSVTVAFESSTDSKSTTNQASNNNLVTNNSFQSSTPIKAGGTAAAVAVISLLGAIATCVLAAKGANGNTSGLNLNRSSPNGKSSQKSATPSEVFSTSSIPKHWKSEYNPRNMARYTGDSWD